MKQVAAKGYTWEIGGIRKLLVWYRVFILFFLSAEKYYCECEMGGILRLGGSLMVYC